MFVSILATALLTTGNPDCATALAAAPAYTHCAQGEIGVALSRDQTEADALIDYARTAEARFERHFTRTATPYLVMYVEEDAPVVELINAGFPVVLAWPSPQTLVRGFRDAMLQNARGSNNNPISPDAEAAIDAQIERGKPVFMEMQPSIIAHELGHLWFKDQYWRNKLRAGDSYGSAAPDWLDETAAMLNESDAMAASRRSAFFNAWSALTMEEVQEDEGIGDLAHFFERPHPSQTDRPASTDVDQGGSRYSVRLRSGDKEAFYDQIRTFADFLIVTTGDERVFAHVTEAMVDGQGMTQWLAGQSTYPMLARDVPGLQRQWWDWIALQVAAR
jgi:hypothetical protein